MKNTFFIILINFIPLLNFSQSLSVKSNEDGFGIMIGGNYNNWSSDAEPFLNNVFSSGAGLNLKLIYGFKQHFNIYAEIQYNKQFAKNYTTTNNSNQINIGLQYSFSGTLNKIRPYVGAGLNISNSSYDFIDIVYNIDTDGDGQVESYTGLYKLSGVGINLCGGIRYYIKSNLGLQLQLAANSGNYTSNTLDDFDLETEVDYFEFQTGINLFYRF